jgi:hypothetical protein
MKKVFIVLTVGLMGFASVANAAKIGVNFGANYVSLGSTETAGVVPQINWNNASGTSGSANNVVDNSGAVTTADVSWASQWGTWSCNRGADTSGNAKLMTGYLDPTWSDYHVTVTVSQIPYALYDVYVYVGSASPNATGHVDDGTTTNSYTVSYTSGAAFPGFVETTDTAEGNPVANYAKFGGKTNSSVTLTTSRLGNASGMFGVQIVDAGEIPQTPAITALSLTNQVLAITFTGGELQSSPTVSGSWTGTGNTSGQYTEVIGAGATNKFFRVCSQSFPAAASDPSPANGAVNVLVNASLSWTVGSGATSHDVYFGTSNPPGFKGNQGGNSYNPGALSISTTYYWRIDEKNSAGTKTGTVWSFTTTSVPPLVTSVSPATYTVQYNALAVGQPVYVDRDYTFTDVASLGGSTYIKTANDDKTSTDNPFLTFNVASNVVVYVAHDDRLAPKPVWLSTFSDTGENLVADTTLSLYAKEFAAGTVTLGGNEGNDGSSSMYSVVVTLAPTAPPGQASNPNPTNGVTDVSIYDATLSWTPGSKAFSHDVYWGTSNPPDFLGNQTGITYNLGSLGASTTYYWRIDEKNSVGTTTGTVWSFTTGVGP